MSEIIPFGKYRGQPAEVLQSDPGYLNWMRNQDGLLEKYPQLRTVIVNNFAEPSETPEHNAYQAMFLDEQVCNGLLQALWETPERAFVESCAGGVSFEKSGFDVLVDKAEVKWRVSSEHRSYSKLVSDEKMNLQDSLRRAKRAAEEYLKPLYGEISVVSGDLQWVTRGPAWRDEMLRLHWKDVYEALCLEGDGPFPIFKYRSVPDGFWDGRETVEFQGSDGLRRLGDLEARMAGFTDLYEANKEPIEYAHRAVVNVEIKPSLGDDYPAVLRQISAATKIVETVIRKPRLGYDSRFFEEHYPAGYGGTPVLFIGGYSGIGATFNQVRAVFAQGGVAVVTYAQVAKLLGAKMPSLPRV